jgi:phosphoribosyl 1,2-cyclic phosphodiesterase
VVGPAALRVTFWGVRGSIPSPGRAQAGVGGNTSCVEIALDGRRPVVLDGGTGMRAFGLDLVARDGAAGGDATVVLSHFHWDHVQAIPFFPPMYRPDWAVAFHAARPQEELEQVVGTLTGRPYFSDESAIRAEVSCREIGPDGLEANGLTIRPFAVRHPGTAHGYRIEAGRRSVVYATDHEHGDAGSDRDIREHARDADLLIWDSHFTPDEFDRHKGWGHSTWLEGTRVAADAGVEELVLFHHEPQRNDVEVARIERDARGEFENTFAAREGLVLSLTV